MERRQYSLALLRHLKVTVRAAEEVCLHLHAVEIAYESGLRSLLFSAVHQLLDELIQTEGLIMEFPVQLPAPLGGELPSVARIFFGGLWCHCDRDLMVISILVTEEARIKGGVGTYCECDGV